MHIVAVSYSWLSTETLSSGSPLITSHQLIRKDAFKMWSRAPSGDESWVLSAAQLQPWKHLCKTTGTPAQFRRVCFLERNKTIVGLCCLKLCDGIHQEIGFPLCVVSLITLPRFPPVRSHFCSSALVVFLADFPGAASQVWVSALGSTHSVPKEVPKDPKQMLK